MKVQVNGPDGRVFKCSLKQKDTGFDCLRKLCDELHLVEGDYFGLQYTIEKSHSFFWLNLRNPVKKQLPKVKPVTLYLRVKYFVSCQEIQQSLTSIKEKLRTAEWPIPSDNGYKAAKLFALITQALYGPVEGTLASVYKHVLSKGYDLADWRSHLRDQHQRVSYLHREEAEMMAMELAYELPSYGTVTFHGRRSHGDDGDPITVVVGSRGFQLRELDDPVEEMPRNWILFSSVCTLSCEKCCVTVALDGSEPLVFCLQHKRDASEFYRLFTEFFCFYQETSVSRAVLNRMEGMECNIVVAFTGLHQLDYIRHLYLFDVVRTRREAYDLAWRRLHPAAPSAAFTSQAVDSDGLTIPAVQIDNSSPNLTDTETEIQNRPSGTGPEYEEHNLEVSKRKVSMPENLLGQKPSECERRCAICLDAPTSSVFCPCGHLVCCHRCSLSVRSCPICRAAITHVQRTFL